MNAPIDVLAVMDRFANRASYDFPALTVAELREARAAVAELIEAAQGTLRLTGAYGTASVPSISLDPLRNALSRIGG